MKFFLSILTIVISVSCDQHTIQIESVLKQSERNRPELEKVLAYYSQNPNDSLKYKAVCYLIENMGAHYSYKDTTSINSYYNEIDSASRINYANDSYHIIRKKYRDKLFDSVTDLKCITAEYLISSINHSFDVWQNNNWAKHVNFEDFCEYILPYKVTEYQSLDNWKEYFSDFANEPLNDLQYCEMSKYSSYRACETVFRELRSKVSVFIFPSDGSTPIKRMSTLAKMPFGTCRDYAILSVAVMRAQGIPVAIDYTPQWPNRSMGHSWNVLLNNSGKNIVFDLSEERPGMPHKDDHKFGKIYRETYAINKNIEEIHKKELFVPDNFLSPCFKDVTDEYVQTQDIKIKLKNSETAQYAYLAVFDNKKWVPIHWGKIVDNEVEFTKMGRDIVYLPVCYGSDGIFVVADPVKLTCTGSLQVLKPDKTKKQNLVLFRKFPYFHDPAENVLRLVGGKIQASNNDNFKDCVTLHTIKESTTRYEEIILEQNTPYRYWRYYSPNNSWGNIAELAFFEKESASPVKGRIIGTEGSFFNDPNATINAVFDNDPLTFFNGTQSDGCWAGMDFGKEVNVNRIIYLPRGDGNSIELGNEYELVYWDHNSWKSLGKKIADDISLEFKDCPTNALFLLHNYTKGTEERIFTYENGEQIWW